MVQIEYNPAYSNASNSDMTFRIHLPSVLGDEYNKKKKHVCLKLLKVSFVGGGANVVDTTDSHVLRTSNIWFQNSNIIGNKTEVLLGQATNFQPEHEEPIFVIFHRGDLVRQWIAVLCEIIPANNQKTQGREFACNFLLASPDRNRTRWRWNFDVSPGNDYRDTVPPMENQIITINNINGDNTNVTNYAFSITNPYGNVFVYHQGGTAGAANYPITLTPVPEANDWFMYRHQDIDENEGYRPLEVWMSAPSNEYLDFRLQLRDIHTDRLQPAITTTKVMPTFSYQFEITMH